jgi:hypothetical protein
MTRPRTIKDAKLITVVVPQITYNELCGIAEDNKCNINEVIRRAIYNWYGDCLTSENLLIGKEAAATKE